MTEYLDLKKRKSELDKQSKEIEERMKSAYAPVQEALKGAEKGVLVLGDVRYQAGYTKRVTTSINKESLRPWGFCTRISAGSTQRPVCPGVFILSRRRLDKGQRKEGLFDCR